MCALRVCLSGRGPLSACRGRCRWQRLVPAWPPTELAPSCHARSQAPANFKLANWPRPRHPESDLYSPVRLGRSRSPSRSDRAGPQSESSGPLSLGRPGPRSRRRNPSSRTQWPGRDGCVASGFQSEAQAPCMCAGGRPAPGRQGGDPESWQLAVTVLAAGSDLTTSGPPRRARMTCPTGHRQGHGCRRRRRRRPWQLPSPRRTWQFKLTMIT